MNDQGDGSLPRRGRGYPPIEHRWKPGTSGNPRGRPRGSKNKPRGGLTPTERVLLEEANRSLPSGISVIRGVLRSIVAAAGKGSPMAQRNFTDRVLNVEAKAAAADTQFCEGWEYYVRHCEEICLTATPEQRGEFLKDLLPHPDDVHVDFTTRTVRILGPATTSERRIWLQGLAALADQRKMVLRLRREAERKGQTIASDALLVLATDRFICNNDALPDRYKLPPLPVWRNAPPMLILADAT